MPVSTDGVLLGAWADASGCHNLLDIGCGTGLLSLMLAQRFPGTKISAIDIDKTAVQTTRDNALQSLWADRINVLAIDVTAWEPEQYFDHIVCNPPYFTSGIQASSAQRATARHHDALSHLALVNAIEKLLSPAGSASLILPVYEGENLIELASGAGLTCRQKALVKSTPAKPASRLLIRLQKGMAEDFQPETTELVIQDSGKYTPEFIALTRDFYLKM